MYEYQCDGCQEIFEEFMKADDETSPVCPSCRSTDTRRLISMPTRRSGATPFDNLDTVKMMHPGAPRPSRPASCPSAKGGGGFT
jgi:putative FmdB family regulatory protein